MLSTSVSPTYNYSGHLLYFMNVFDSVILDGPKACDSTWAGPNILGKSENIKFRIDFINA
jgi:hypothetical protein